MVFDQGLVLTPKTYLKGLPEGIHLCSLIYIQASDIEGRFSQARKNDIKIISNIAPWGRSELLFFRCLDPEGNVVEVFSADAR